MKKLDWRIRLGLGIIFFILAIVMTVHGFQVRGVGGSYNQYWVLALILLWGASESIRKAFTKPDNKATD